MFAHLTAGFAEFRGGLCSLNFMIETNAGGEVALDRGGAGAQREDRIGRSGRALEICPQEIYNASGVAHFSGLHTGFQAERVSMTTYGEQSVGELQDVEEGISVHGGGRGKRGKRLPGGAPK